jgi:acyl transferase domain-containing protein
VSHRMLSVSRAFHSPLMSSILAEYESELSSITLNRPVFRFLSSVDEGVNPFEDDVGSVSFWMISLFSTSEAALSADDSSDGLVTFLI